MPKFVVRYNRVLEETFEKVFDAPTKADAISDAEAEEEVMERNGWRTSFVRNNSTVDAEELRRA